MADIQAFNALRYDLAKIGMLSDVVAPPYDVIDEAMQSQLYDRHDNNITRVILNRSQADEAPEMIYERAAKFLKDWRKEEIIQQDNKAAVYLYEQKFSFDGVEYQRRGFMCRVRLEAFDGGRIFPHEQTHSKAKKDRYNLMTATRCNTSPIFGIYPDETNEVFRLIEAAVDDSTPVTATDELGVEHQMRFATNSELIAQAAELMGPKPLFIADGHHRYETALNYRNHLIETQNIGPDHPANYVLMMCVSMSDPGMIVLPTHRIFRGFDEMTSDELKEKIQSCFDCETPEMGLSQTQELWSAIELEGEQSTMAFFTAKDNTWTMARLNAGGLDRMAEIATDQCDTWQSLGVSLLHKLVIETLLGKTELPTPMYVHSTDEFAERFAEGDSAGRDSTGQQGSGEPFQFGALVMPAKLSHVRDISLQKERMPAKSTYFYPKLLSGLLLNPLD